MNRRRLRPAGLPWSKGRTAAPVLVTTTLAAALALSGCQVMSPVQTTVPYQPGDGVAVDLGDVQIRDFVVVSSGKGEAGVLSGMVVNNGAKPVAVTFTAKTGGSTQAEVLPGTQARLSGVQGVDPITLPAIDSAPGAVMVVTVSTPGSGASEVSVPVLPPAGYYATITAPPPTTS